MPTTGHPTTTPDAPPPAAADPPPSGTASPRRPAGRTEGDLDVAAILHRIGLDHRPAPGPEALALLQRAWVSSIPFENLDIVLGRPIRLQLDVVQDKLIRRRRGGYCLEHVALFVALLRELGWDAHQALATMPDLEARGVPPTHATAIVRLGDERWMADVGFGGGPLHPLPLRDGAEVGGHGTWAHRLVRDGERWQQQSWRNGGWSPTHATSAEPATDEEIAAGNHWVSTDPTSLFVGRAVLMRVSDRDRIVLVDHELRTGHPGTEETRRTLDPDERLDEITRGFGVVLDAEERTGLR